MITGEIFEEENKYQKEKEEEDEEEEQSWGMRAPWRRNTAMKDMGSSP